MLKKKSQSTLIQFPAMRQSDKQTSKNMDMNFLVLPSIVTKLAGLIIACVISGVVRDKMSPSVKYVLHTTLSNGWDNTRVVSGDDCWPGHCCKLLFSVCESFDVTGASFTERRTFNVCGERTVFVGIIL